LRFVTGAAVPQVPAAQGVGLLLRIEAGTQLPLSLGGKGSEPLERVAHGVLKGRHRSPALLAVLADVSDAPAVSPFMGDQGGRSSSSDFQCAARKSSGTQVTLVPASGVACWLEPTTSPIVNVPGDDTALK